MSELVCLELSVVLWIAYVLTQALTARAEFGDWYLFTPRDEEKIAKGLAAGRATRALNNYVENYGAFIAMDLALIVTQHAGGVGAAGATVWILARILDSPVDLIGTPVLRTGLWTLSVVGLLMMLARLAGY